MQRGSLLLLGCMLIALLSSCGDKSRTDNVVSIDSPCLLAAKPSKFDDQKIKVTAFITYTKEGGFIWGNGCKYSGIRLQFGEVLAGDAKFRETLLNYGMSPSPIKATLVGRFRYKRFSGLRALIFGEKTFEAEQVFDLQISSPTGALHPEDKTPTRTPLHESSHVEPLKAQVGLRREAMPL
jgi:hypothetical protein